MTVGVTVGVMVHIDLYVYHHPGPSPPTSHYIHVHYIDRQYIYVHRGGQFTSH